MAFIPPTWENGQILSVAKLDLISDCIAQNRNDLNFAIWANRKSGTGAASVHTSDYFTLYINGNSHGNISTSQVTNSNVSISPALANGLHKLRLRYVSGGVGRFYTPYVHFVKRDGQNKLTWSAEWLAEGSTVEWKYHVIAHEGEENFNIDWVTG